MRLFSRKREVQEPGEEPSDQSPAPIGAGTQPLAKAANRVVRPPPPRPPGRAAPAPRKKNKGFSLDLGKKAQAPKTKAAPKPRKKGLFSFGGKKAKLEPAPTELIHIEGHRVLVPTYEDIDRYQSIVYPVREPYQFVNLEMENGELVYRALEPRLTAREKEILEKAANAFDMLVNVGTVLTSVEDKLQFLEETFRDIVKIYNFKLSEVEYRRILYHIERDYVGYGKVDTLVRDRFIEDISCNGPDVPVFIYHRFFESIRTNIVFDEVELNNFLLRLAQLSGRHISILQPIRDAALPDGSRINMTLGKEVTKKGSTFTIRKFRSEPISPVEIVMLKTGDVRVFAYLWILIEYGRSLLISGGTAAGKTTLLNAISMLIKPENKIVSVEDTPEINLAHPNWIQAVTRVGFGESGAPSGISGISGISGQGGRSAGDITLYDLLIAALRQRPDFIIVGEVRGEEAYTLFQAISVGHATMGTIHAASMSELLARVESQPMNVPRVMVANLDLVIFVAAMKRGDEKVRRMREVVEILGVNPSTKEIITNTIFTWDPVTDTYLFNGRSFQIEKISRTYGIPMEKLDSELERRVELLERMIREGITNYKAVTDLVRQYYLDKDALVNSAQPAAPPAPKAAETAWVEQVEQPGQEHGGAKRP
ncbi:MAG TPA: type II/IV secretion system ATPase subunit [Nitrososphaerales archaeon]|nr:type II/IV secretion system ATPase subunit [Nitrososphaerales archaeon]